MSSVIPKTKDDSLDDFVLAKKSSKPQQKASKEKASSSKAISKERSKRRYVISVAPLRQSPSLFSEDEEAENEPDNDTFSPVFEAKAKAKDDKADMFDQ